MKIKLRGKTFDFVRKKRVKPTGHKGDNFDGFCDNPTSKGKRIVIDKSLTGQEELETILHETLHGAFFDLSEDAVNEAANDITRILWKLGYRREE